ncbi:hypothetical protein M2132_001980 [Dysgonomonas sp. PH5-45]|uniref:hypothetical protein n=1 Tax=unclassified Dysgonomonas TaxID=2630389 RepID=UPI002473F9E5|nr:MULTISPECIES: hypothetical protein [unclassified Dysgonomonas]MDH6355635.1 hypothetical protein [Dysgonomonas sp. PH5-45]MDH6388532.1 hypothetical protein [Dysgonomonas sp. PH5-37]
MMKKLPILLLFTLLPMLCSAQFFGLGGQYTQKSDGQFFASFSYPTFHPKNKLNSFISSGLDFTTSGGAKISGLNVKPIQLNTFFSEKLFNSTPYTLLLGVDGGYNFDFRHGRKNGIVITPNIYFDYKFLFLKAGYDFDVTNGNNQFFVRAGFCFGMGTIKMFPNTKIW